jgi:hypothetical protein
VGFEEAVDAYLFEARRESVFSRRSTAHHIFNLGILLITLPPVAGLQPLLTGKC